MALAVLAAAGLLMRAQPTRRAPTGALQDLRLLAAVELAYFAANGRYAPPEELKAAGFLDRLWPRTDPKLYRISYDSSGDRLGFLCFADPLAPGYPYFRVDATQAVRFRRDGRPNGDSPLYQ